MSFGPFRTWENTTLSKFHLEIGSNISECKQLELCNSIVIV